MTGSLARHGAWLAWREMKHDPASSLCFIIAFIGSALPLVLLLALKQGAIGGLIDDITEDPRSREISPTGAGRYDREFVAAAAALPDLAFFTPDTRSISARLHYARGGPDKTLVTGLALLPTGVGDPLVEGPPPDWSKREIYLSSDAAKEFGLGPGGVLEGFVERSNGAARARVELTVIGVAPPERLGGLYVLAPLALLESVETFLDDETVTPQDWLTPRPRAMYASFRAYAETVEQTEAALAALKALGAKARMQSDDVAALLRLNTILTWLYAIVAVCGAGGFFLALMASLRANVERQRQSASLLVLMGGPSRLLVMMTIAQSLTIVGAGLSLTFIAYIGLSNLVNSLYRSFDLGEILMSLDFKMGISVAFVASIGAVLSSFWAAYAAHQISPESGFRGVG